MGAHVTVETADDLIGEAHGPGNTLATLYLSVFTADSDLLR